MIGFLFKGDKQKKVDFAKNVFGVVEYVEDKVIEHMTTSHQEKIDELLREIAELEQKMGEVMQEIHDNKREVARMTGRYGKQLTSEVSGIYNAPKWGKVDRIRDQIQAKRDEIAKLESEMR